LAASEQNLQDKLFGSHRTSKKKKKNPPRLEANAKIFGDLRKKTQSCRRCATFGPHLPLQHRLVPSW
jgi:hypothetical protein